ncbi:MAG: ammonia-forming cytochrome c nitrite reductase subunit c552 [Burkholderiales bacterium]
MTSVALLAIAVAALYVFLREGTAPPAPAATIPPGQYAGSTACRDCHQKEHAAWQGSHHAAAMQEASDKTVLGDFGDAKFAYAGTTSTFFRRDGRFFVSTDGPEGKLADYEIKYTFGITPLQQYLIAFPDGRIQALSVAWDARPKAEGGQRWFHLYPAEKITHADPLHWTKLQQNWNFMCADCHSTNLRKNYDPAADRFRTTWSEINVGCEACHGPASNHVAWARKEGDWRRFGGPGRGLGVVFNERQGVAWAVDAATGNATRSRPRESAKEIETCARCHARRAQIGDDYSPGRPIGDAFLLTPLEEGLYWPDGQMRDEVYNHGSFAQSKMFARGVTCSDCHDPHSQQLKAPGNAVCAQCHLPAKYDAAAHHHHPAGSKGAACAACHMPSTTYMVVDPRHDHSLRIPQPELSVKLGTPNACNSCHTDKPAQWAADAVQKWYGRTPDAYQAFGEAFAASSRRATDARSRLLKVAGDRAQPAIVRASALERLALDPTPIAIELASHALNDPDELVRRSGVQLLARVDPAVGMRYLPRMLGDPVRAVRIEAARALAAQPADRIPAEYRAAFDRALDEYLAVQRFNADRPEAHLNLGALYVERGELDQAEAEYKRALELAPGTVQPVVNLADLYRARGDEQRTEELLRGALKTHAASAPLRHALGLAYARQKRQKETLAELAEAARLAPDVPRYAYVYGVALHSFGDTAKGIAALEQAHQRFPGDRAILQALAAMERDRGDRAKALAYAEQFAALAPDDPAGERLVQELRR